MQHDCYNSYNGKDYLFDQYIRLLYIDQQSVVSTVHYFLWSDNALLLVQLFTNHNRYIWYIYPIRDCICVQTKKDRQLRLTLPLYLYFYYANMFINNKFYISLVLWFMLINQTNWIEDFYQRPSVCFLKTIFVMKS